MFDNCKSLRIINELQNWNVYNGTDFSFMFCNCFSLQNIKGLEKWNVSNGTDFSFMFANCELLQEISLSNTFKNLTKDMFYQCNSTLKIHWKKHIYTYTDLLEYKKIY